MCGFVGMLDPHRRRRREETERLIERMADVVRHRGPDGYGQWCDAGAGIALGHRRLAVLDLSPAGHQPMSSADGRFVVSYNGEIYNHRELAAELGAAGVAFRGHSDTEILVEAVSRWGMRGALDRVDGMFAFAMWDSTRREVTLVRDRIGEKPLYYGALANGEVLFGSSVDSFRRHPDFDPTLDRDALALYLRHKYVPAPWSIYAGVAKLEPGHLVVVSGDGAVGDPQPYWSYLDVVARGATFDGDERQAVDHLDDLLRRSVRRRLVADVPVGAFLSGGVDSSTVVGAAQAESRMPVRTFTIGSNHEDFDESDAAREVAGHLGTDHTEWIVTGIDALAVVDRLGDVYDEPFGDSSQIPTLLVSELARRDVTVALSGDAGDELFGGYNRYTSLPGIRRRAERLPAWLRRSGAAALDSVPPEWWDSAARLVPRSRRPQQVGLKVAKSLQVAGAASPEDAFLRLVSHWQEPTRIVVGGREPATLHTDPSRWPETSGIVEHMMAVDAVTYLPDDILVKVDRAAMAVSLETRVPLLDRDIVEFAAALPLSMRVRPGSSKWILRQVLDRYVPRHLVDRPKAGFGLPVGEWLRGPLRPWAEDLLAGSAVREHLDRDRIDVVWRAHLSRRRDHTYELWDVLMFAAWASRR